MKVDIQVVWTCDKCLKGFVVKLDHEPDEYKDEYPFSLPYGWIRDLSTDKIFCSEVCLGKKDLVWIA